MPPPAGILSKEDVDSMFTYHSPKEGQNAAYAAINEASKHLVEVIIRECPNCPDRTTAIRTVRLARMWANAGIACEGRF
jgi:hypothetical protein